MGGKKSDNGKKAAEAAARAAERALEEERVKKGEKAGRLARGGAAASVLFGDESRGIL